jgi:hypothetical protein
VTSNAVQTNSEPGIVPLAPESILARLRGKSAS